MKNPEWFDNKVVHKAVYVGPASLPIPWCKMIFREFWPNDGCYDHVDLAKRKWAEVECIQCNAFDPNLKIYE